MELSPKVGRMCAMNLYLHGIGGDKVVVHAGHDSLAAPWSREYSMVLTNPPFGKKQSPARRHPAHAPHSQSREVGGSHLAFDPAKLRRPLVTVRPRDDRRQARRHLLKIDQTDKKSTNAARLLPRRGAVCRQCGRRAAVGKSDYRQSSTRKRCRAPCGVMSAW
jgi:hypothetical protein